MLTNYGQNHRKQAANIYNDSQGLKFAQDGRNPPNYRKKKCCNCGVVVHISREFPKPRFERDNCNSKEKCENRKDVCRYEAKKKDGNAQVVGLVVEE